MVHDEGKIIFRKEVVEGNYMGGYFYKPPNKVGSLKIDNYFPGIGGKVKLIVYEKLLEEQIKSYLPVALGMLGIMELDRSVDWKKIVKRKRQVHYQGRVGPKKF